MTTIPNLPPLSGSCRMMLIGDGPTPDDLKHLQSFSGWTGIHLDKLLNLSSAPPRSSLYLGNIHQFATPFSTLAWGGPEIQFGTEALAKAVEFYNPNIIVLLGNAPLKLAKDPLSIHSMSPKHYRFKTDDWRGSLFLGDEAGPFAGRKCMATYHPSSAIKDYSLNPLIIFDLKRAVEESATKGLFLPKREIIVLHSSLQVVSALHELRKAKTRTSIDIEGGLGTMSCVSFSWNPFAGFVIPFYRKDGVYVWSPTDGTIVWRAFAQALEDVELPKCLQAGLYDRFVLHYGYNIRVQGVTDDTMLSGWEVYNQLEKGLGVQCSIWTREPHYKGDRKTQEDDTFYRYNGMDSLVTEEIEQAHEVYFKQGTGKAEEDARRLAQFAHYKFNVESQDPLLHIEVRGIRYDSDGAAKRRAVLLEKLYTAQAKLNFITGYRLEWKSVKEVFASACATMCKKKFTATTWSELFSYALKPYRDAPLQIQSLLNHPSPNLATIGQIEDLLEVSLNVGSQSFTRYLYETLKLPTQYTKPKDKKEEPKVTADYEALLNLAKHLAISPNAQASAVIHLAIEIRSLATRTGMLEISSDDDGRIRCGYNIVGSYTGRVTSYKSPTGSGYNLQTIPNYTNEKDAPGGVLGDRDLFIADPGYWFFQCDLKGADGWTVAAYAAMLGDRTMLEDYQAGLKPANILALMLRGIAIPADRKSLKEVCRVVKKDDWDYFACKRVQHGCSYLEGGRTVSRNILKDSEGKLYMAEKECNGLKELFFKRYPGIRRWHEWTKNMLASKGGMPFLTAVSGQRCFFFDRPEDNLTKAVAFEPQSNTTYANNLAMLKMWKDPENLRYRRSVDSRGLGEGRYDEAGNLRAFIEPLHSVHDAICGQFPKLHTSWATGKIRGYYENPLTIAGQTFVIPFDGAYGPSWGDLSEGTI